MEEYRDLDLTIAVFTRVLEDPRLHGLEAGIVLQSYLPDALPALTMDAPVPSMNTGEGRRPPRMSGNWRGCACGATARAKRAPYPSLYGLRSHTDETTNHYTQPSTTDEHHHHLRKVDTTALFYTATRMQ